MLMASAQRWVDNQCCRCVLPCPDYKTPISGECSDLIVWYVGICDVKSWILLTCFVYMAIYDLEIQLFHSFSVLTFFFFTFLYFQLRSVGYIALYKLNFQNWQHWKCLKTYGDRSFNKAAPLLWNELPYHIRSCNKLDQFKRHFKSHLFNIAYL